jgi:hypothetical protein
MKRGLDENWLVVGPETGPRQSDAARRLFDGRGLHCPSRNLGAAKEWPVAGRTGPLPHTLLLDATPPGSLLKRIQQLAHA